MVQVALAVLVDQEAQLVVLILVIVAKVVLAVVVARAEMAVVEVMEQKPQMVFLTK